MRNFKTISPAILLFFITLGAFCLRLFRIQSFDINGDEWYTLANAQSPGRSYYSLVYFSLITFVLRFFQTSFENLRIVSAVFGALTVPVIYKITARFDGRRTAFIAALLFTVAAFNIAESQEMRMYSLFCFLSSLSTLLFLYMLELKTAASLVLWFFVSLLNFLTHFNAAFLLLGQIGVLVSQYLWPQFKTPLKKMVFLALLLLMISILFFLREAVFFTILRLAEPVLTLKSGIRGYNLGTFFKIPFTFFQFIVGPNTSPYELWAFPLCALSLLFWIYGIWHNRNTSLGLSSLFLLIVPVVLLFLVVEPFSNPGFTLVMPKHAIFAFPIFIVGMAAGLKSLLEKKKIRLILLCLFLFCLGANLFRYFFSTYTYYSGRTVRYHKIASYLSNLQHKEAICVVDGRSSQPFKYYASKHLHVCDKILSPEQFVSSGQLVPEGKRLVLAVSDWTAYHGKGTLSASERYKTYVQTEEILNKEFQITDGFVDYPLFFYIFKKKDNSLSLPFEFYDFRYQDLYLPLNTIEGQAIRSSFHLAAAFPEWEGVLSGASSKELMLYINLEDSHRIKNGEKVSTLELTDADGRSETVELRKGENVWDSFEMPISQIPSSDIAAEWTKYPLVTSSIRYPGFYKQFKTGFFKIKIDLTSFEFPIKIKILYLKKSGALRLWGLADSMPAAAEIQDGSPKARK